MTTLIQDIKKWRALRAAFGNKSVGCVPTMGNLHEGHLSLIRRSVNENDITVLSCFVNPTQFNDDNDFKKYPRTLAEDIALCKTAGVDYLFAPKYDAMYPDHYRYQMTEKELSCLMEGKYRPGHFDGVLTVVLKLLLLIKPDNAYFGEKDFQQLRLIHGLVEAFFIDTNIVFCATVRDTFGLALSSRNRRLSVEQMNQSRYFPKYLHSDLSCEQIIDALTAKGFAVDYVEEHDGRRYAAVHLGDVRLIDNVEI